MLKLKILKWLWNEYKNPYYYWWKVRKYVKRPKAHLVKGEYHGYFGLPCRTDSYKGLQFFRSGLGWKSKYDSPRHEWDPVVCFIFTLPWKVWVNSKYGFKTKNGKKGYHKQKSWWFGWTFNWVDSDKDSYTRSMATWEMILDIVIWNVSIEKAEHNHHWSSGFEKNARTIRPFNNLTELGKEKVIEYESNRKCKN